MNWHIYSPIREGAAIKNYQNQNHIQLTAKRLFRINLVWMLNLKYPSYSMKLLSSAHTQSSLWRNPTKLSGTIYNCLILIVKTTGSGLCPNEFWTILQLIQFLHMYTRCHLFTTLLRGAEQWTHSANVKTMKWACQIGQMTVKFK